MNFFAQEPGPITRYFRIRWKVILSSECVHVKNEKKKKWSDNWNKDEFVFQNSEE